MDKRERILAALNGERVDRVPFTMWRHFYLQCQTAKGLSQATLDFYRRYDIDLVVLRPGPFYMAEGWGLDVRSFGTDSIPPQIVRPTVERTSDWRYLPEIDVRTTSLHREIEAVRLLREQLDDVSLVICLPSPLDTADMLCNGRIVEDIRSFSSDLRSGLQVIAEATREFALACMEAGADGFVFTSTLASKERLRAREYRDFGQPFDLQVLNPLHDATIRILALAGERLFFDLADRYPVQAVLWETWRADPSMAAARRQVRCGLMGGLNPATFVGGSVEDIKAQVLEAVEQTGGWHVVIALSGPLPPDSRTDLLAEVRQVVEET